jgi:hypothetical protein
MKPKPSLAEVRAALIAAGGIDVFAAKSLGCSTRVVRAYRARHPSLQKVVDDCIEANLDLAESQLIKAIENGSLSAIVFYLKTKGRRRGYAERRDVTGKDGETLSLAEVTIFALPDNGRGG